MQLRIRTQPAILNWNVTDAKQTTPSMPKEDLKLDIKEPEIKMKSTPPKVDIDQNQCFNESGLKDNQTLLDEMVSLSKQAVMEGIAHRVQDGNQLMAIENGQDAIAEQASYNAWDRFVHEFGLVTMPQSRPVITVENGDVEYEYIKGEAKVANGPFQIDQGTYEPWKIERFMKQYQSIDIQVVGDEVDISL